MSNPSSTADVVIVGGGPAGAATALLLARAGLHVVVLDRERFPRAKACGECLSAEAARVLDRLGLLQDVLAEEPARLSAWRIHADDGTSFKAGFAAAAGGDTRVSSALAISRARFDAVLLRAARDAGAVIVEGCSARSFERGGNRIHVSARLSDDTPLQLSARMLIGADGLRSRVATRFGFVQRAARLRKFSLTAHVYGIDAAPDVGEMHLADGLCCGVAPLDSSRNPLFNVTIVADAARFGRSAAGRQHAFFRETLARFTALRERVPPASLPLDAQPLLASGPFDRPVRAVAGDSVALVGDAAGYFDPFTGQGIYQALSAAESLAGIVADALAQDDCSARVMRGYTHAHAALVWEPRILQHALEHVLKRPALARYCIGKLASAHVAAESIIAATGDLRSPRSLLSPDVMLSFMAAPRRPEMWR